MEPKDSLAAIGVRPIKDQVVVRQDKPAERIGSLYVPDSAARELQDDFGVVVGVGPKVTEVRAGDRVLFRRRPESALNQDRRLGGPAAWDDILMLRESDIVLVIEE